MIWYNHDIYPYNGGNNGVIMGYKSGIISWVMSMVIFHAEIRRSFTNMIWHYLVLPSGKRLRNYGKSPCSMGKSTISMAMFNSYVKLPEGKFSTSNWWNWCHGISGCFIGDATVFPKTALRSKRAFFWKLFAGRLDMNNRYMMIYGLGFVGLLNNDRMDMNSQEFLKITVLYMDRDMPLNRINTHHCFTDAWHDAGHSQAGASNLPDPQLPSQAPRQAPPPPPPPPTLLPGFTLW